MNQTRPHCPRCRGMLQHNRATERGPEHVSCKLCGWMLERSEVPVISFVPAAVMGAPKIGEPKATVRKMSERRLKAMLAIEAMNQREAERSAAIADKRRRNKEVRDVAAQSVEA